ncbi:MAG: hypothetical protein E7298_08445 [Lachnospiraceae bacterium]|nr:hypothetical protein [Lachnospiraceae bacterium]
MLVTYIGSKPLKFTGDNGDEVRGTHLYIGYPEEGANGLVVDKIFLRENIEIPGGLKFGDKVDATFSPKGKLISIIKM